MPTDPPTNGTSFSTKSEGGGGVQKLVKEVQQVLPLKIQKPPPNGLRSARKIGGKRFDYQFLLQWLLHNRVVVVVIGLLHF